MEGNTYKNENYSNDVIVLEDIKIEKFWENFCKEILEKWK